MESSWSRFTGNCKSRLSALARALFLSRERWREKCADYELEIEALKAQVQNDAGGNSDRENQNEVIAEQVARIQELEAKLAAAETQQPAVRLPDDPLVYQHQYGSRLISLSVNLACEVGLRAAERVLKLLFDWLGIEQDVPTWQSIRLWMQRVGLARMSDQDSAPEQMCWLVDHSVQVGKEKALVVLGVPVSKLPEPGQALKHEDVTLLTIEPGTTWKAENVGEVYRELEEQYGAPRAILADGAAELRDGAKSLKNAGNNTLLIRDLKHYLANQFEATIGNSPRFAEFIKQVTSTRAAVQQTELAHLGPSALKQKARFMNMAGLLNWAKMARWQLDQPKSQARQDVADERLKAKLNWLSDFDAELQAWCEYQEVVSCGVTFASENGIFCGAAQRFRELTTAYTQHASSRELIDRTCAFMQQFEDQLQPRERLPLSTEIVESCFGKYKQLEGQHSKGGFTQLLVAFGALLKPTTPATIVADFARVKVKDVNNWCKEKLATTMTSKRQSAYKEYRLHLKPKTQECATPVPITT